jgi:hypothetical protein
MITPNRNASEKRRQVEGGREGGVGLQDGIFTPLCREKKGGERRPLGCWILGAQIPSLHCLRSWR